MPRNRKSTQRIFFDDKISDEVSELAGFFLWLVLEAKVNLEAKKALNSILVVIDQEKKQDRKRLFGDETLNKHKIAVDALVELYLKNDGPADVSRTDLQLFLANTLKLKFLSDAKLERAISLLQRGKPSLKKSTYKLPKAAANRVATQNDQIDKFGPSSIAISNINAVLDLYSMGEPIRQPRLYRQKYYQMKKSINTDHPPDFDRSSEVCEYVLRNILGHSRSTVTAAIEILYQPL